MMDRVKDLIADLARPFTLYAMGFSGAWATVIISRKVDDGNDGALVLAAIGLTVSALYAGKVIETYKVAASNAEVEKERAKGSPPPDRALQPATGGDGELPPDQRVSM
jgi:Na+/glutamate symporter